MPLDKNITIKQVEGSGEYNETEDKKQALKDHIKQQMEERKESSEMVSALEAVGVSADILHLEARRNRMEKIILALQEEGLTVLDEFQEKIKDLSEGAEELKEQLPELITKALDELDRKQLLTFIDEAMAYNKNEEFKYMVESFSDEQRDRVYQIIHSEEITDKDHETLIWRFESLMGYSMKIVEEEILKDLSSELEPYREFIRKFVRKPDGKTRVQLEQMKTFKNFNLSEKMIAKYSEAAVHRFRIDEQGEEIAKQAFEEFKEILTRQQALKA